MSAYEIVPRVWFGAAEHTYNPEFMLLITHIVNVDDTPTSTNIWARAGRQFLHLSSQDNHVFPILQTHSQSLFEFIERALIDPAAHVFIHCYMGLNRSAALAIAYASHVLRKLPTEIIASIRADQRHVLTNSAFEKQLTEHYNTFNKITLNTAVSSSSNTPPNESSSNTAASSSSQ